MQRFIKKMVFLVFVLLILSPPVEAEAKLTLLSETALFFQGSGNIAFCNNYAFVPGVSGVEIFHCADSTNPQRIGIIAILDSVYDAVSWAEGGNIYLGVLGKTFYVYDVTNSNPQLLDSLPRIFVRGLLKGLIFLRNGQRYLLACDRERIFSVNISDPRNIFLVGSGAVPDDGYKIQNFIIVDTLAIASYYLYAPCCACFNISNLENIKTSWTITQQNAHGGGLYFSDNYLYLCISEYPTTTEPMIIKLDLNGRVIKTDTIMKPFYYTIIRVNDSLIVATGKSFSSLIPDSVIDLLKTRDSLKLISRRLIKLRGSECKPGRIFLTRSNLIIFSTDDFLYIYSLGLPPGIEETNLLPLVAPPKQVTISRNPPVEDVYDMSGKRVKKAKPGGIYFSKNFSKIILVK